MMYLLLFIASIISCAGGNSTSTQRQLDTLGVTILDTPIYPIDTAITPEHDEDMFTVNYIMGQFEPALHADFVKIDIAHADREGLYLRADAYEAFKKMYEHALNDSVHLQIRSATRNFNYQKGIWEAKWTGERLIESGENLAETTPDPKERALKILRYSSMPGTSRHHWGTDIDLNSFENSWFEKGQGLDIYNWLTKHAHEYGFCQPYSAGRPNGYLEERWHWSYTPVSEILTEIAKEELKNEMIQGFLGSETAVMIDVVNKYVLGIDEECK